MARGADESGFIEFLREALDPLGGLSIRRMFGGAGIFRNGLMFGLVSDDRLFLKVDDRNQRYFEAEGLKPFTYARRDGSSTVMSFWATPERLLDDADELRQWAERSIDVAQRKAATAKRRPT